jgi:hypothetical protein
VSQIMLLTCPELDAVLARTQNDIELRDEYGKCFRIITNKEALALDLNLFVGIGNTRRIRFLRFRTQRCSLNLGSKNTRRVKNEAGKVIAHPLIQEHRPFQTSHKLTWSNTKKLHTMPKH